MSSSKKTVLITGCSAGGIGHALAKEFHSQGLRVFATSRTMESMIALSSAGIETMVLDVTDLNSVKEVRDRIAMLAGGKLDILVNNAGRGIFIPIPPRVDAVLTASRTSASEAYPVAVTDMEMSEVRDLFEVNLFAPMIMVQEFVHLLIASGDGRIVHTGSISGIMPVPFSAAYNASKAALHSFNNTLRVELAPFNVKVINLLTGGVKSNISRPHTMSDDSLYKGMEDLYISKRMNASQVGAWSAERYAHVAVNEILRARPKAWHWSGQNSNLVWFIDTFLGRRAFDWLMNKTFGMKIFARRLARRQVSIS